MSDEKKSRQELRRLLRWADPLSDGEEMSAGKARSFRARLTQDGAAPRRNRRAGLSPAYLLATAALVAGVLGFSSLRQRATPTPRPASITTAPSSGTASDPRATATADGERRQLRFETPGGTRVIWEMSSEFSI